ncbi:465_t:CDS:2 [Funneliformis mosseae]|uniref:465_t:CDS:1 n=1 Tax=Funneliformis mosseae TaxID=27381 RepID=A0A9N9D023_FUNMO|nr:465_t:CDS:2 [Funneliformis mosseae]
MLKSVVSLIFKSNSTDTSLNTSKVTETSTTKEVNNNISVQNHSEKNEIATNNASLIQLVRQQRQKQLKETILMRNAAHRSLTSHYEQEHLPLSQVQEKLEEENLPLIQVQHQLEQQKDDPIIYTTTKESLRSLLFNQRKSYNLLTKPKKSKLIGRIMNLIDTIGVDPIQRTCQEVEIKTFENSSENVSGNQKSKEPMNLQENSQCGSIKVAEIISDNVKISSKESEERDNAVNTLQSKSSGNLVRDSGYGEKSMPIVDNKKRHSGFFRNRRSNNEITNSEVKNSVIPFNLTLRGSKSRRKSLRPTTDDIIEPEEDELNNTNSRNKFFTIPKRTSSAQQFNKSLQSLRNLWKVNQQQNDDGYKL